jgi:hypothetical protein
MHRVLVEKPEGKRRLRKLRCRWKNIIKIDFRGGGVRGRLLSQDRAQWRAVVNTAVNVRVA